MIYDKILFSPVQPSRIDIAWAKPVKGGFALYLYFNGKWQPQTVMNDEGTATPEDDVPVDVANIPSMESLEGKIEQEVTEQMKDHDAKVQDTHHAPSSDPGEYPDIIVINESI